MSAAIAKEPAVYDLIVTVLSEDWVSYPVSARSQDSDEQILDDATGFYEVFMVRILEKLYI